MSKSTKLYEQNLEILSSSGTTHDKELVKSLHLGAGNYVIIPSLVNETKRVNFLLLISSHKQIKSW